MKINWGTGIVLVMISFMAFILYFVIVMSTDNQANHDLVVEEYYKAELGYQQEIDAEVNARELGISVTMKQTPKGLLIHFPNMPEDSGLGDITGTVSLYRPSNKHLDFDLPISLSKEHLLVPDKRLVDGRWDIKISWKYKNNSKLYMRKKKITY